MEAQPDSDSLMEIKLGSWTLMPGWDSPLIGQRLNTESDLTFDSHRRLKI